MSVCCFWKAANVADYPLVLDVPARDENGRQTRANTAGKLTEVGRTKMSQITFVSDGIKVLERVSNHISKI